MIKKSQIDLIDADFFTVKGVIGKSKVSKDGTQIFEPVRKFLYGKNKVALSISLIVPTTVQKRPVKIPVDIVCFDEEQFDGILDLNLESGTAVEIFARKTARGLVLDDCNWVQVPKSI